MTDAALTDAPAVHKTPAWLAVVAAAVAVGVAVSHPLARQFPVEAALSIVSDTAEYIAYALLFFGVFWVAGERWLWRRRLSRRRWPRLGQVWRETLFSFSSQFTFLAVALWLSFGGDAERNRMYTDIEEYGWPYYALVVGLTFVVHDTWFYWSHRAMHHPWLFDRFHRLHHESVDPTPFTTYSFHPLEAIVEGMGGLMISLVLMIMPWHVSVPVVWGIGQILFNSIGHLGYEIYPSNWNRLPLLRWKAPAMHHYMHHQRVGGNYGLYFRFWDRLCGTEFRDFEARYDRFFERGRQQSRQDPTEHPAVLHARSIEQRPDPEGHEPERGTSI